MATFKLSDPGSLFAQDPAMAEYLRAYEFPIPPEVRYGFSRIQSPQERYRVSLMAQAWVPSYAAGTVALLHGYSEHIGNYARLVRDFVGQQLAVIAFDFRGHGLSEGPAGHVQLPSIYAEDAEAVLESIFPQLLPSQPLYLWGHSLGGMVGLQLLQRGKLPVAPVAAAFTSPLLGFPALKGVQKILAKASPLLSKIVPALPVAHGLSPQNLSHDELYLARRFEDPLMKHVATPQWLEATKLSVAALQKDPDPVLALSPTLLMLAGDERITNLSEARRFAARAYASQKHKLIEFPGSFHELEKEPKVRARVVSESIAWFRSHR